MKEEILNSKIFLACCRKTLANMVPSQKNFLMNEATNYQILHMIYENTVPSQKECSILENAYITKSNIIVSELLEQYYGSNVHVVKKPINLTNFLTVAAISYIVTMLIIRHKRKSFMKKDKCKGLKGPSLQACKNQKRISDIKARIKAYEKGKSLCNRTKNPEKCKSTFDKKIAKLKVELAKI